MPGWRVGLAWLLGVALSAGYWFALGREHTLGAGIEPGRKLQCASYTPFVGDESPMRPMVIERSRLERDFALLSRHFSCVRIYAVKGMHEVPAVAHECGLMVIAGA
jgi:hypothetical protein